MTKRIPLVIFLITTVILGLFLYNRYRVAPAMLWNNLEAYDSAGIRLNVEKFRAKKLIVCYYASWCGDCLRELKSLNEIKNSRLKEIEVICITDESQEKLVAFQSKKNYPFNFYRLPKSFASLGVHSIPVNYFVNTKGQTVFEKVGSIDWEDNQYVQMINNVN